MAIITLTTDFGTQDSYVAEMKGAILSINPRVNLIDLNHHISPQNILEAAFVLVNSHHTFPKNTIHVVVVDPGVGTERRILLVKTAHAFFIAPDNGVLTYILKKEKIKEVRSVENKRFFRKNISATFHGRDIMGPVAAHLSQKVLLKEIGPKITDPRCLKIALPKKQAGKVKGEIIAIDRFGNLITNIMASDFANDKTTIQFKEIVFKKVEKTYWAVRKGQALALVGSSRYLEIAVNQGSAAKKFQAKVGNSLTLIENKKR